MADAADLGSAAERREGSSPSPCTKKVWELRESVFDIWCYELSPGGNILFETWLEGRRLNFGLMGCMSDSEMSQWLRDQLNDLNQRYDARV